MTNGQKRGSWSKMATTTFIVKDDWNNPLSSAKVTVMDTTDVKTFKEATTDSSGKATISMDEGLYHVIASKSGYKSSYPTFFKFDMPTFTFNLTQITTTTTSAISKPTATTMVQPKTSTPALTIPSQSGSTLSKTVNVTRSLPTSAITQAPETQKKEEDFVGLFAESIDEAIADFKKLVKNMTGVDL